MIPESYNISFKKKSAVLVEAEILINYIREIGLNKYGQVMGFGGKEYSSAM